MSEQENKSIKRGLFQSAKARLLVFGGVLVVGVIAAVAMVHHHYAEKPYEGSAAVARAPSINSEPGTGDPSDQYVKLQNVQNAQQDQQARKEATSSVPTITRPSFVGNEDEFNSDDSNVLSNLSRPVSKKECAIKKVVYMYKPNPANCSVPNLKRARQAGVTAEELLCQACSCEALRVAGYSAGEMKNTGYEASKLKQCGYPLEQLIAAGYTAKNLKQAGFSPAQLRDVGFSAGQLADAGFTGAQLKAAGYSPKALQRAGIKVTAADCSVSALKKARAEGVSANVLKDCGVSALKAAGFSAAALKNAGFSARALKDAGFSAAALKRAGFSAKDLENAGFSEHALRAAGFTPAAIKAAHLVAQNCSVSELKAYRAQGLSATALKKRGCSLEALKAAGFTAGELRAAGFSATQLRDAGFSAKELHDAGFSAAALNAAGFSAKALKAAGFNANQLKNAGFSAAALKNAGFSAAQLRDAGFLAKTLRDAGYAAADLKAAGFDAKALKEAGFSAGELKAAGFSAQALKNAGFSAKALRAAGYNAADLKAAGFDAKALKAAGFTSGDLLRAGFNARQAGYVEAPVKSQPATVSATKQDQINTSSPAIGRTLPSITDNTQEGRLRALQKAEQAVMQQQQAQDLQQQMQLQMMGQAQKIMAGWSNPSQQKRIASNYKPEASAAEAAGNAQGDAATGPIYKAGEIMFAVLDTSVNSDDTNTPVMATIVQGPLKGTKLLGSFTRVKKRLLVKFTTANVPSLERSIQLNAVAIDPRTAHSVLSGYVNSHYLLRYGSLFASSFLSGLAQGVLQSKQTCLGIFGCFSRASTLKPSEYIMLGAGNAGQQYANVMGANFNTPPTVRIPGGSGIGILYMSDLTLPHPLPKQGSSVAPATQVNHGLTDSAE